MRLSCTVLPCRAVVCVYRAAPSGTIVPCSERVEPCDSPLKAVQHIRRLAVLCLFLSCNALRLHWCVPRECMCGHLYTHSHTCTHTQARMHTTYTHAHRNTCTLPTNAHTHTHAHTQTHAHISTDPRTCLLPSHMRTSQSHIHSSTHVPGMRCRRFQTSRPACRRLRPARWDVSCTDHM